MYEHTLLIRRLGNANGLIEEGGLQGKLNDWQYLARETPDFYRFVLYM